MKRDDDKAARIRKQCRRGLKLDRRVIFEAGDPFLEYSEARAARVSAKETVSCNLRRVRERSQLSSG